MSNHKGSILEAAQFELALPDGRGDPRNLSLVCFRGTTGIEEMFYETHSDSGGHSRINVGC
jgi:hypothetical protein